MADPIKEPAKVNKAWHLPLSKKLLREEIFYFIVMNDLLYK